MENIIQRNPNIQEFEVYMHMYSDLHQQPFSNAKLESPDDIRAVFDQSGGDIRGAKVTTTSQKEFDDLALSTWLQESDTSLFQGY